MSTKAPFSRLFDQLDSISIGYQPLMLDIGDQSPNYPPYNIVKLSDDEFKIEIAVAGFHKSGLSVELHQGKLTVRGEQDGPRAEEYYQHHGISSRPFSRGFRIAEYFEVSSTSLVNGILSIGFTRQVPDSAKPRLIAIE